MTPPNGYTPVESAAIHAAGLADQPMLYWREDWDAPRVMRWCDLSPYANSLGWYAREFKALTAAMAEHRSHQMRMMGNQALGGFSQYQPPARQRPESYRVACEDLRDSEARSFFREMAARSKDEKPVSDYCGELLQVIEQRTR